MFNFNVNRALLRLQFNASKRLQFYEWIGVLYDNNIKLSDALLKIASIAEDKHSDEVLSTRAKSAMGLIAQDIYASYTNGKSFSESLRPWVSYEEAAIIGAGEKSGRISESCVKAIEAIGTKNLLLRAAVGAGAYPIFLAVNMWFLFRLIAHKLVPSFSKLVPTSQWEGNAKTMHLMALLVTDYAPLVALVLIGLGVLVVWSLPNYSGAFRVRVLERLPPWNIYKMIHGVSFLINVAILQSAGMKQKDIMDVLAKGASPWLRQRIEATKYGIAIGKNLGDALVESGYQFPDKVSIRFLSVLSDKSGAEKSVEDFAKRWRDQSVRRVELAGKVFFWCSMALVVLVLLAVIDGSDSIMTSVQSKYGR